MKYPASNSKTPAQQIPVKYAPAQSVKPINNKTAPVKAPLAKQFSAKKK